MNLKSLGRNAEGFLLLKPKIRNKNYAIIGRGYVEGG
jgi:hypothetical protein